MNSVKKHLPIIFAILLPIIFVIAIVIFAKINQSNIKPAFQILFVNSENTGDFSYKHSFKVVDNKLVVVEYDAKRGSKFLDEVQVAEIKDIPNLYVYDFEKDSYEIVDLATAKKFFLDQNSVSPDGYSVNYRYGYGGITELFGGSRNESGYYVTKNNSERKKINLGDSQGYNRATIIGWIIKTNE